MAQGATQLKCMCLLFQCQIHLCVTIQDAQISEGSKATSVTPVVTGGLRGEVLRILACMGQYGTAGFISFVCKNLPYIFLQRENRARVHGKRVKTSKCRRQGKREMVKKDISFVNF